MAYRGPHVSVTQNFTQTPAAVAIEKNPPFSIGTAYDVYRRSNLGTFVGVLPSQSSVVMPWLANGSEVTDVVWDSDLGRRYEMFPVAVYAKQGTLEKVLTATEDYTLSDSGVSLLPGAAYTLAEIASTSGLDIPMLAVDADSITAGSGNEWVINSSVSLSAAGIVKGLPVYTSTTVTTIVSVQGQVVTLADFVAPADAVFGSFDGTNAACITRRTGSFLADGLRAGDVVRFTLSGESDSRRASVVSASALMVTINYATEGRADTPADITKAWGTQITERSLPTSVIGERLVGFSSSLLSDVDGEWNAALTTFTNGTWAASDTGVAGTWSAGNTEFTPTDSWTSTPSVGDRVVCGASTVYVTGVDGSKITVGTAVAVAGNVTVYGFAQAAWSKTPVLGDVIVCGDSVANVIAVVGQTITVDTAVAAIATVDLWRPDTKVTSEILADFRAVSSASVGTVQRITTLDDIRNTYCNGNDIDDCNELAFMLQTQLTMSGSVVYGCNVEPDNATDYAEALENSLLNEVYGIALGSTQAAVNALAKPHVELASEPYQARERIAVIGYDTDDVFVLGQSSCSVSSGVISDIGFPATLAGVQAGDEVAITSSLGVVTTTTVAVTPNDPDQIVTYASSLTLTGATVVVRTANKDMMAEKIADLGTGVQSRRVTVVFPGWFQAVNTLGEVRMYPPYYIAAAITGMDSGTNVSQSQTNLPFQIPGLSQISLGTNFAFRKELLDVIGGGGVDILIQDSQTSTAIKSRHDLTTNMDSVEYRERSITKQVDTVAKAYRSAMSPYIGRYNINGPAGERLIQFLSQVASVLNGVLVKGENVASVTLTGITRDSVVADKLNFEVAVTVYVAGNYYDITLNVVSR